MGDRWVGRRRALVAVPAVTAMLLLGGCGGDTTTGNEVVTDVRTDDGDGMHGAVLTAPYSFADATLTDSAGDEFDLQANLEAPLTLVFFGYSRCPDICQAVMADLASAMGRLAPEHAEQVDVWFVTTDPARDDPQTLREYLDRFNPEFEGLTGPLQEIIDVAETVHVPIERGPKLPSGGYEVTHGTPVLGVLDDGTVPIVWTEGTSAAKLAEDITAILDEGIPAVDEGSQS